MSKNTKEENNTQMRRMNLIWEPRSTLDSLNGRGPTYLSQSYIPISETGVRAHLRFAARKHLTTPQRRSRTCRFGPRSFRVSGPVVWNYLPDDIINQELTLECFKTGLKTHLLREAYAYSHNANVAWLKGA